MMSLLDRYIARQYVFNVVALFVILLGFVMAVDVAVNLDHIWEQSGELAGFDAGLWRRVGVSIAATIDIWWPRMLQLFNLLNGVVLAGAMGFTCIQLARHRELVAVLAGGQSLRRVLRPILIVAAGFCVLQLANQEFIMPRISYLLPRDHRLGGVHDLGASRVDLTADALGRLIYARSFDADTGVIEGFHVWIRDDAGRLIERIRADRAVWRDGAWRLEGAVSTRMGHAPAPVESFATNMDPTMMHIQQHKRRIGLNLSWRQASAMLARKDLLDRERTGELIRIKYGRLTIVAADLLVLAICAPIFITRLPGGRVAPGLKAAPVVLAGMIGPIMASSTALPGFPAIVGVLLPVIILSPIAVAAVSAMRT